jgi:hypothetical protein
MKPDQAQAAALMLRFFAKSLEAMPFSVGREL